MADALFPVLERIVQNIVEALENVSTAAAADRSLTVERPKPSLGNRSRDALAVVTMSNPKLVGDPEGGAAYLMAEWLQPFGIILTVVESEQSDVSIDERLNVLRSDVEKALLADPHRGGLAIDTLLGDAFYPEPESLNANVGEVWVLITVHYRTRYDDPYTQE